MIHDLQKPYYKSFAAVMRERILSGDYGLKPLPSERTLAEEMGVNYMTIRRGLNLLESEGLLSRQQNGRMGVSSTRRHRTIALLVPSVSASQNIEAMIRRIETTAAGMPCTLRAVLYRHWEDQTLRDAVEGFDGTFLYPLSESVPQAVLHFLQKAQHKVVSYECNASLRGIPTIRPFPPAFVEKLLEHLRSLGHRAIGCLNTQPPGTEVEDRINQWRYWMAAHDYKGRLVDIGSLPHADGNAGAYRQMKQMLKDKHTPMQETAWLCITAPAAMATMRALLDHGLQPGKDIAVCAINGEGFASYLNPRLTSLELPDTTPFIRICLQWMLGERPNWEGPLMMQPANVPLEIHESTLGKRSRRSRKS